MSEYLLELDYIDFNKSTEKEKDYFIKLYNQSKDDLCYYNNKYNRHSKINLIFSISQINDKRKNLLVHYVTMNQNGKSKIVAISICRDYNKKIELITLCTINNPKEMNNKKLTKIILDAINLLSNKMKKVFNPDIFIHNDITSWWNSRNIKSKSQSRSKSKDSYETAYKNFEEELEFLFDKQDRKKLNKRKIIMVNKTQKNLSKKNITSVKDSLKHLVGKTFTNKSRKNITRRTI